MDAYTKAKEKLAAIFNQAPWLKTDGKAVHLPISGLGPDHQLTWPELYALYRESDNLRSSQPAQSYPSDDSGPRSAAGYGSGDGNWR